jgi:hypothetical protein
LPALVVTAASWSVLIFGLVALQGIPPNSELFGRLHVAWLGVAAAMLGLSIAGGRYYSRSTS